ncbi:MAG: chromate transporter [Candidatus Izemoplasmatales bacterium]
MIILILIRLFLLFIKVALFNFGGGFAMIPLISAELEQYQWLTSQEFMNIIAISQMTPGAIAINTSTFVGYQVGGILGAVVSTLAIPLPSMILVIVLYPVLDRHKNHPLVKMVFYGLRPVVAGLIIAAVFFVGQTAVINSGYIDQSFIEIIKNPFESLNFGSIAIAIVGFFLILKTKINPILLMVLAAFVGILIF